MPVYIRFLQNGTPPRGSVTSGTHIGWTEVLGFEINGQTRSSAPEVSEIVVTKVVDSVSPLLRRGTVEGLVAEVDFTRVQDRVETSGLRILIHGIRSARCQPVPHAGRATPVELSVIVYRRMTRAGTSALSADITQQVRAHLQIYDYPGGYAQRFDGDDKERPPTDASGCNRGKLLLAPGTPLRIRVPTGRLASRLQFALTQREVLP